MTMEKYNLKKNYENFEKAKLAIKKVLDLLGYVCITRKLEILFCEN